MGMYSLKYFIFAGNVHTELFFKRHLPHWHLQVLFRNMLSTHQKKKASKRKDCIMNNISPMTLRNQKTKTIRNQLVESTRYKTTMSKPTMIMTELVTLIQEFSTLVSKKMM